MEPGFSFELLAKLTPGYVGADLLALVREAAVQSVTDILSTQKDGGEEPKDDDTLKASVPQANENLEIDSASVPMQMDITELETMPICTPVQTSMWIKDSAPLSQQELDDFCIHMKDFERALKNVQPSSKREGFVTVPDTTWDDIGALKEIRDELEVSILVICNS